MIINVISMVVTFAQFDMDLTWLLRSTRVNITRLIIIITKTKHRAFSKEANDSRVDEEREQLAS